MNMNRESNTQSRSQTGAPVVAVFALRKLRPRRAGGPNVVKFTPRPRVPSPDAALGDGIFAARKSPPKFVKRIIKKFLLDNNLASRKLETLKRDRLQTVQHIYC